MDPGNVHYLCIHKGQFPLARNLVATRAELAPAKSSAVEIAVRKYFECVSNDLRDRLCPVEKSSRKAALFYLIWYYFLSQ